jgi:hypothetical protein
MTELAFSDDFKLFDGDCVRFRAHAGNSEVMCGVTLDALIALDRALPRHGLIPAEEFLAAFERQALHIHHAARLKHRAGRSEAAGSVQILIEPGDLAA